MVDWAFSEYFKTGIFPPKPANIQAIIRQKRESMYSQETVKPMSESDFEKLKKDRKSFFGSKEYADFLGRMKRDHGL